MKTIIKIRKNIINEICDMAFIFISIFNAFYLSVVGRITVPAIVTVVALAFIFIANGKKFSRRIKVLDVMIYFFIVILVCINYLTFNVEGMKEIIWKYIFITVPMMFAGIIIDFEKYDRLINYISVLYIVSNFIYVAAYFTHTNIVPSEQIDYMGFAYNILPSVLIVSYKFLTNKKLVTLIPFALGILHLVICGTRGPFICLLSFFVLYSLSVAKGKNTKKSIIMIGSLLIGIILLFNVRSIALAVYPVFEKYHFSTRLLMYFIRNDNAFLDASGRRQLYTKVFAQIKDHIIFGSGLMNDRTLLGNYSHNLILELLNSFGFPITLILLVALVILSIKAFRNTKSIPYRGYLLTFFSCSIIKLMLSSSFMLENALYIYLGLCLVCGRRGGRGVSVMSDSGKCSKYFYRKSTIGAN